MMATRYRRCPHCGKVRVLQQVLEVDGVKGKYRTCFHCFKVQQEHLVTADGSMIPVVVNERQKKERRRVFEKNGY